MVKKALFLIICSFTLLTACSKDDSSNRNEHTLKEKNEEIVELKEKLVQQEVQIADFTKEKEEFAFVSNTAKEFVQAHTTGDKEKLSELVSKNVVLVEKETNLYARIVDSNNDEWLLFNQQTKKQFVNWVIQGYNYDSKTNTFTMFIREFYIDVNGEPISPPTFLILTFKTENNAWKIYNLAFDV